MAARSPKYNGQGKGGNDEKEEEEPETKDKKAAMPAWLVALLVTLGIILLVLLCLGVWYFFRTRTDSVQDLLAMNAVDSMDIVEKPTGAIGDAGKSPSSSDDLDLRVRAQPPSLNLEDARVFLEKFNFEQPHSPRLIAAQKTLKVEQRKQTLMADLVRDATGTNPNIHAFKEAYRTWWRNNISTDMDQYDQFIEDALLDIKKHFVNKTTVVT